MLKIIRCFHHLCLGHSQGLVYSQAPVAAVTWPWALLTIIKRDMSASESPLRKFATVFSQSKNHYEVQMWYQRHQKSVKFDVTVIFC